MQKLKACIYSIVLLLAGCATYHPKPLNNAAMLAPPAFTTGSGTANNASSIDLNFQKPLTPQELAVIAVITDPDLIALRAQEGVAAAQVFSAGLLPDPVMNLSFSPPMASPGSTNAYSVGPNFDIGSFVTSRLQKEAATASAQATHDNIAWQEWLVANQAHLLAIRIVYLQSQVALAKQSLNLAADLMDATKENLLKHEATATEWETRRSNYFDAKDQLTTLTNNLDTAKLALNALLGFPPSANLNVAATPIVLPKNLDANALFLQAENSRLDLQALQAGYQNQEIQLHNAILGQFPHFNLGFNRARDNSDLNTWGVSLAFDLPLWNRNRGQIAIQTATREQLYQEYRARLNQTRNDIATLTQGLQNLQQEDQSLKLTNTDLNSQDLAHAFENGQIDLNTYTDLTSGVLAKKEKLLALEQSMAEQCVALQIAVGKPLAGATC